MLYINHSFSNYKDTSPIDIEEFMRSSFPVKINKKVKLMTGEEILIHSQLKSFPLFKSTEEIYPIFSYLALNDLYFKLNTDDKRIIDHFFRELPRQDLEDNLHYVNDFMFYGFKKIMDDLLIFYEPLVPYDPLKCEDIVNYMNDVYATDNYDKALNYTHFAEMIYKKCPRNEKNLRLVAKYGLLAYNLKSDWLNLWKKKPVTRLDYFWITLCNVLKKLNRYDEAIDIAKTGIKYKTYDVTASGWQGRLEKLEKAKMKYENQLT